MGGSYTFCMPLPGFIEKDEFDAGAWKCDMSASSGPGRAICLFKLAL